VSQEFRIAQVLRDRAAGAPDQVALVDGDGRPTTYGELDQRSNRLAQYLLAHDVTAGDRVAHLDRNAPGAAELLLAAAKIGAVLVPLNWRLAEPELRALLEDSQAKLLFFGPAFADVAQRLSPDRAVAVDRADDSGPDRTATVDDADGVSDEDPKGDGDFDAVVLQLYTSGTTGRPKGVQTTNRNLSNLTAGLP
jgi:acyl-CoA synthetase (AMP-forming)/AMP-acid ligase II